jgi:PAS domain S-box-containing protein
VVDASTENTTLDEITDLKWFLNARLAIVGGGSFCRLMLEFLLDEPHFTTHPVIVGVADPDPDAIGLQFARRRGIPVAADFRPLLDTGGFDVVLEITRDPLLADRIRTRCGETVRVIDHFESRALWDRLHIEKLKNEALRRLPDMADDPEAVGDLIAHLAHRFGQITQHRSVRTRAIEKELVTQQQALAQIVEGSTIPTFVIDRSHTVTYWNRALELLTGVTADTVVGTNRQWAPFWDQPRPSMADVILDQLSDAEIAKLYDGHWRRSELIPDAYEAEAYFSNLGENGLWCWFTAAPIRSPDGEIIGAIETLQDITEKKNAEKEITAQIRKLAEIIEGSTIPTFVIGPDHRVTHWNRALERLTGVKADQMVGTDQHWKAFRRKPRPLMADVILDQFDEAQIRRYYGSGWRRSTLIEDAYEAEEFFPNLGPEGTWCWFTAAPIRSPDGTVVGAIETLQDVSEKKHAEQERIRHNRKLATLCSIYTALNAPLDLDDRISSALLEIRNSLAADIICLFVVEGGRSYCQRYHHGTNGRTSDIDDTCGPDSILHEVAGNDEVTVFNSLDTDTRQPELAPLVASGIRSLAYIPIDAAKKKPFGVIRIGSRRESHFQMEELYTLELIGNRIGATIENAMLQDELARRNNFQSKLIRSSNDAIVATDEALGIVIFNPVAERLFGVAKSAVVGKQSVMEMFSNDLVERVWLQAADARDVDATWRETTVAGQNGKPIPVRYSATVLRQNDRVMGIVAFFQDLSEIKRLERELLHSERLAAVGQTVAGMAHCIKNILHGFKGGSFLMNVGISRHDDEKVKSGWRMVQRNITRTSDLVMDLLSYSKEREPDLEACDPNAIVSDVCETMAETAEENHVALNTELAADIGEVLIDPRALQRCLLNLVSNAIDACLFDDAGGKRHAVVVRTRLTGSGWIRIDIQDNGLGMSDEVRRKLFSSFFSTKGAQGTGLGLLVTGKLVEEQGGRIAVVSEPGVGTTFTVHLPFQLPKEA